MKPSLFALLATKQPNNDPPTLPPLEDRPSYQRLMRHPRMIRLHGGKPDPNLYETCPVCRTTFVPIRKRQTYCGNSCKRSDDRNGRRAYWRKKAAEKYALQKIARGQPCAVRHTS